MFWHTKPHVVVRTADRFQRRSSTCNRVPSAEERVPIASALVFKSTLMPVGCKSAVGQEGDQKGLWP